jgi:hypothetical protein
MHILPKQPIGPNATEFQRINGGTYKAMFQSAKEAALKVDGTSDDPDPRDGFVTLSGQGLRGDDVQTLVSLWGQAGAESASVRFVSGSYVEEAPGEGRDHHLGIQKDRYIEISEDRQRGLLKVDDRLSQSLTNLETENTVIDDHKDRGLVVTSGDGTVVAEDPRDVRLLFDSGWSLAEFQRRRADLDA